MVVYGVVIGVYMSIEGVLCIRWFAEYCFPLLSYVPWLHEKAAQETETN